MTEETCTPEEIAAVEERAAEKQAAADKKAAEEKKAALAFEKASKTIDSAAKALHLGKKDIFAGHDLGDGKYVFVTVDGKKLRFPEDLGEVAKAQGVLRAENAKAAAAHTKMMKDKRAERVKAAKAEDARVAKAQKPW